MWHAWGKRKVYTGFSWENLKRPLGRPKSKREDNIAMDLKDAGWEDMD
jgi:hypothetical protein